jgi:DNA-directed RNA polymerase subunit F
MEILEVKAIPECEAVKYFRAQEEPTYNFKLANIHAEKVLEKRDEKLYKELLEVVKNEELAAKLVDVKPQTPELVFYMASIYDVKVEPEEILKILKKK